MRVPNIALSVGSGAVNAALADFPFPVELVDAPFALGVRPGAALAADPVPVAVTELRVPVWAAVVRFAVLRCEPSGRRFMEGCAVCCWCMVTMMATAGVLPAQR